MDYTTHDFIRNTAELGIDGFIYCFDLYILLLLYAFARRHGPPTPDMFDVVDGSGGGGRGGDSSGGGSTGGGGHMDVKVVYANPNGTLSILPDGTAGVSPWRPSSVSLAAAYLTLSSAAIASNVMVLSGIVTADRLRSPYAVLVSALCLQCAIDATVGHCVTTRELLAGAGGGGATVCRGVATVTAALSAVELVTFAALACLTAFVRSDYAELPLPAAATLWAAPSMYTYVILTPTLLFTTRYFPSRYVRGPTFYYIMIDR